MLEINNLTFAYPHQKQNVIDDISLRFEPGSIYGLLGPNGAGKSTLLYLICGLLTPKKGTIAYNGIDTRLRLPATLSDTFLVPEEFAMPRLRLSEYIKLWERFYPRFSQADMFRNLEMFGFEHDMFLGSLSMGQKKKAYMCMALAANTSLLVMDEPTNGLDIPGKANFRSFIASNMTDERTIIISTHQVLDVASLIDHVVIMDEHNIRLNQSMARIMQRLAFFSTPNADEAARALYSQPSVSGYDVVTLNDGDRETEVNLETLFQLATTQPQITSEIFKTIDL